MLICIAPLWVPDEFTNICMMSNTKFQCRSKFSFTNRRHHCRYCGRLICNSCSKKLPHWDKVNKKVRVCQLCKEQYSYSKIFFFIVPNSDFFTKI